MFHLSNILDYFNMSSPSLLMQPHPSCDMSEQDRVLAPVQQSLSSSSISSPFFYHNKLEYHCSSYQLVLLLPLICGHLLWDIMAPHLPISMTVFLLVQQTSNSQLYLGCIENVFRCPTSNSISHHYAEEHGSQI